MMREKVIFCLTAGMCLVCLLYGLAMHTVHRVPAAQGRQEQWITLEDVDAELEADPNESEDQREAEEKEASLDTAFITPIYASDGNQQEGEDTIAATDSPTLDTGETDNIHRKGHGNDEGNDHYRRHDKGL